MCLLSSYFICWFACLSDLFYFVLFYFIFCLFVCFCCFSLFHRVINWVYIAVSHSRRKSTRYAISRISLSKIKVDIRHSEREHQFLNLVSTRVKNDFGRFIQTILGCLSLIEKNEIIVIICVVYSDRNCRFFIVYDKQTYFDALFEFVF